MPNFSLYFEGKELVKTLFEHPVLEAPVASYRGNSCSGQYAPAFKWSPAVRALSLLFLNHKLLGSGSLYGKKGSLAASLDYAVTKRPAWLMDMFGADKDGKPILLRLMERRNSNLKLPGPVTILLKERAISKNEVQIFLDGTLLIAAREIETLHYQINNEVPKASPRRSKRAAPRDNLYEWVHKELREEFLLLKQSIGSNLLWPWPYNNLRWKESFAGSFFRRVHAALADDWVFGRQTYIETGKTLLKDLGFCCIAGPNARLFNETDLSLSDTELNGITTPLSLSSIDKRFPKSIHCACPISHPGALLLLFGLRYLKGLPVVVDFSYSYSDELLQKITAKAVEPDIAVLGLASTASVLSKNIDIDYQPLMFAPNLFFSVVRYGGGERVSKSSNTYVPDPKWHHERDYEFFFSDLVRKEILTRDCVEFRSLPFKQKLALAKDTGRVFSTIEWFLTLQLLRTLPKLVDMPVVKILPYDYRDATFLKGASTLFLIRGAGNTSSFVKDMNIALRDVWATLRDAPQITKALCSIICNDPVYIKIVTRMFALHKLDLFCSNGGNYDATDSVNYAEKSPLVMNSYEHH